MTVNRDDNGNYRNPLRPNAGPYLSVTTAISRGVPKDLDDWHKKIVAEYAVDNLGTWRDLDRADAVDLIKRASDRQRDAAGAKGTIAHEALDAYANGRQPDPLLNADAIGFINAGLRFLTEWQPDLRWTETEVFSDANVYAGTLDLLAHLPGLGLFLLDWKTGKRIYPEVGLQLAAYRYADYAIVNDEAQPIPDVVGGLAVHLRPDGTYNLVPVECGDAEFDAFLKALGVAGWRSTSSRVIGPAIAPPGAGYLLAARADWLKLRVAAVLESGATRVNPTTGATETAGDVLARNWPQGVPTLRDGGHDRAGLDAVAHIVDLVETAFTLPFPPADPNSDKVARAEAEPVAARLRALPADLVDAINEAGKQMALPPLLSGRLNRGQLDAVAELVGDAEKVAADRRAEADRILDDITGGQTELHAAVEDACRATGGAWTPQALDALCALKEHVAKGVLVFTDGVLCTVGADGLLVDWFGSKREALAAVKPLAEAFGLPKPKSVAEAASNPTLVALAGASVAA